MKVKVLGFSKPNFDLEENFEFISMGSEQVGGAKGWSNYLIDYFSSIDDEYFVKGLDDFMIVRPVDEEVFKTCLELLSPEIGRIDLQPSLQYSRSSQHVYPYTEKNDIKFLSLVDSGHGHNLYQNAAAFSIWNRQWFLKNIRRDWSPWDWEITGSMSLADGDGYKVLGTVDRWAVRKLEILSSQWSDIINVRGIREEDLEMMKKLQISTDRLTKFEPVMEDKWYYEVPEGTWETVIFGK